MVNFLVSPFAMPAPAARRASSMQQHQKASVLLILDLSGMFRPDPHGEHSVEDVIAKLTDVLKDVPDDASRATRRDDPRATRNT